MRVGLSISPDVRDADFTNLTKKVARLVVVESASVLGVAGQTRTDAELGVVLPVVHQFPPIRVVHLPDEFAVEKVIMRLIPIAELPDDMVPLIVDDQGGLRTGEVPPA